MKKELYNTTMSAFIMSQFSARQNKAIISLIKLKSRGNGGSMIALAQVRREEQ
jgi:hypothetical protein